MKIYLLLLTIIIFQSAFSQSKSPNDSLAGREWSNSGLEVKTHKIIPISIPELDEATKNMGITINRIRTKCEFKIRQMNLEPVDFNATLPPQPYQLMISVQASKSSFLVELDFLRTVSYNVGDKTYEMYATTWSTNGFGAHGNDPEFILSSLEGNIEEFLNAFVKENSH
jgi:hypothetical protein